MIRRCRVRPQDHKLFRILAVLLLSALAAPSHGEENAHAEWPFVRLKRPAIPAVHRASWMRNPIDAFVLAALEKEGLQPNPPADKLTLLRRVTFDLTGLLPTPSERDAFLADTSPDAYERLVDRLLRSPRFGERWAQHWLDVVRYAETDGFKLDRLRPNAWRYRDYVIRACNDDLPYDRFLSQQLAGDELEPSNPDALIATGFYRLPPEETNGSNYRMVRQDILDDVTDVFSTSILGLTLGCARCHDHKFDPLTQKDYYRLQAFFTPLMQRDDIPVASVREQEQYRRQFTQWERDTKELRAKRDALLVEPRRAIREEVIATFDADTQNALRTTERKRTPLQRQLAALAAKQVDRRASRAHRRLDRERRALYDELQKKIEAGMPAPLPMAMGVANLPGKPPATYRLATGNYNRPRERVEPAFPECIDEKSAKHSSRAELARWLCRDDHPLTSRVMVNRLWQHHLGAGIVASPNDFGAMGDKPTHPELLDYLASELVRRGWKLKAIHRLIVTSATYRQASSPQRNTTANRALAVDPNNTLLWHARIKRREGEAIRDAVLQVSGQLHLRMGGPSSCPQLPTVMMENVYAWDPDAQIRDRNRRSIYILAKRNLAYPLLAAFDQPDRVNSCPVRPATITAPQALAMLNGEFTLTQARHWAERLATEHGHNTNALIHAAYRDAFNREPDREEIEAAERFLKQQRQLIGLRSIQHGSDAALVDLCHALLNSAEFLDVD
jgi:hypothetical protein